MDDYVAVHITNKTRNLTYVDIFNGTPTAVTAYPDEYQVMSKHQAEIRQRHGEVDIINKS